MARNTNDLSGRVNIPTKVATYTGLDTETAEVVIDNVDKTIAVNVDLSDISSQFISQSELDRETSSREAEDARLDNSIDVLETLLENETLTRRSADEYVQKELQKEINRATTKEASLSSTDAVIRSELQAEIERAGIEEARLQGAIEAEAAARERDDDILQGNIDTVSSAVRGLATVATTGDYDDLENKPLDLATKTWVGNQGYITGITSGDVTTALGYTPLQSSDLNNVVTTNNHQVITGEKDFTNDIYFEYPSGQTSGVGPGVRFAPTTANNWHYICNNASNNLEILSTNNIAFVLNSDYNKVVTFQDKAGTIALTSDIPSDCVRKYSVTEPGLEQIIHSPLTVMYPVCAEQTLTVSGQLGAGSIWTSGNISLGQYSKFIQQTGSSTYGLKLPETTGWTADKLIATTDDINDENLAPEFDASSTYSVGDVVVYEGQLYRCISDIVDPDPWDVSYWETTTVEYLLSLKADDDNVVHKTDAETITGLKTFKSSNSSYGAVMPDTTDWTANRTIATTDDIPDSSTLVHTTGDETIDGTKTFTGDVVVNDSGSGLVWVGGSGGAGLTDNDLTFGSSFAGIITNRSIFTNPVTNSGSGLKINQDNITKRTSTLGQGGFVVNDYTFTLPNKSGTIALTSDIPTSSSYVDLTSDQTISGYKTFSGDGASTAIILSNGAFILSPTYKVGSFNSVDDDSVNHSIKFRLGQYDGSSTSEEIYLPRKSGTIALTSDIPSLTNYVTTNTPQNITALKTFSQNPIVEYSNKNIIIKNNGFTHTNTASFATQNLVFADPSTSHTLTIPAVDGTLAVDEDVVHTTGNETILGNKTFGDYNHGVTTKFYGNIASVDTIDNTGVHFGSDAAGKRPVDAKSILTYNDNTYLNQGKALYAGNGITYYYRNYVDGQAVETDYKLDFPNKKSGVLALTSDCTKLYRHHFDIVLTNADLALIPAGSSVYINVNAISTDDTEWETLSELDGGGFIGSAFGTIAYPSVSYDYIFELKIFYSSLGNGTLLLNVNDLTNNSVKCAAVTTVSGGSPNAFELEDSVSPL